MLATRVFTRRTLPSAGQTACRRFLGTMFGDNSPLVLTPAQLLSLKSSQPSPADLVILDASWHMPNSPRKAQPEFTANHIPLARFLDIDLVSSPHPLSLPHMMPDSKTFVQACCKDASPGVCKC